MNKRSYIAIITLLVLVLVVVGCGGTVESSKVEQPSQPSNFNAEPETPTQSEEVKTEEVESEVDSQPSNQYYSVGDTISMGDFELTLNSAKLADQDVFGNIPDELSLVVNATITNISDEVQNVSSMLMFSLYDEELYEREISFMVDTKGSLDGELGPGRSMRGEIAYNIDEGQSQWEFIFEPVVFQHGQAIFIIDIDDLE